MVTRSYTAFVSKNFGLNFLKIRRLRVGTESFLISISSFAKEHVYLSIMSKNCQSHGDVMLPYKVFFTKNDYSSTNFHDNIFKINSPYASRKLYSTIFHRSDGLINFQVCPKRLLNSLFSSIGLL